MLGCCKLTILLLAIGSMPARLSRLGAEIVALTAREQRLLAGIEGALTADYPARARAFRRWRRPRWPVRLMMLWLLWLLCAAGVAAAFIAVG